MTNHWYAVHVRTNLEQAASRYLQAAGHEIFLPTYRERRVWSDRTKQVDVPLFAGYVFCRLDIQNRLPVLQAPGVLNIVGFAGRFVPLPDQEIAALRTISDSLVPSCPWPYFQVGETVRIDRGPLAGIEGVLIDVKNTYRLVVSVELLQRSVAAEVSRDCVERVNVTRQISYPQRMEASSLSSR